MKEKTVKNPAKPLEWSTVQRKVNDLIPLEINPRKISETRRMKMIESLQKFNLVDIPVIDIGNILISGHQRLRAMQAIGRGEEMIDVRIPNRKLTQHEVKEYNLLANTHFGEFDFELLDADFKDFDFDLVPIDIKQVEFAQSGEFTAAMDSFSKANKDIEPQDYSDKNKEIDVDDFADEMIIKLKYTEAEYTLVREQLSKVAETPEQAVWKLLGNE